MRFGTLFVIALVIAIIVLLFGGTIWSFICFALDCAWKLVVGAIVVFGIVALLGIGGNNTNP